MIGHGNDRLHRPWHHGTPDGGPSARRQAIALLLHDVAPSPPELVSAGGIACKSGREVAQEADVVIIMVPDTPHVEEVLFGERRRRRGHFARARSSST